MRSEWAGGIGVEVADFDTGMSVGGASRLGVGMGVSVGDRVGVRVTMGALGFVQAVNMIDKKRAANAVLRTTKAACTSRPVLSHPCFRGRDIVFHIIRVCSFDLRLLYVSSGSAPRASRLRAKATVVAFHTRDCRRDYRSGQWINQAFLRASRESLAFYVRICRGPS